MKKLFLLLTIIFSFITCCCVQVKIKSEELKKSVLINRLALSFSHILADTTFNPIFLSHFLNLLQQNNEKLKILNCKNYSNIDSASFDAVLYIKQNRKVTEYSIGGYRFEYNVELLEMKTFQKIYSSKLFITFRYEEWKSMALKGGEKLYKSLKKTNCFN